MATHDEPGEAEFKLSGRLVAEKRSGRESPVVSVAASDAGSFGERAVIDAKDALTEQTVAIRVQDSQVPYSSGADIDASGRVTIRVEGAPDVREAGVRLACSYVVERLNAAGGTWGAAAPTPGGVFESGIDAVATGPDGKLEFQVVSAEQGLWRELRTEGVVEVSLPATEVAEALWNSIQKKRLRADTSVILVLDAANVAQFTLAEVLVAFHAMHQADAEAVGFKEIWLSGPTADRTTRLA